MSSLKRYSSIILMSGLICLSIFFISSSDKDFKIAKYLDIFVTLFREVDLYYVDEKDPEELINNSIEGMLSALDPYTTFIPESDMDEFQFMTTGQYGGIGALIRKAGNFILISEPYEGFPAQKAGLRAGDTLYAVDGVSTRGKSVSIVSEMLKGNPNTELKLSIRHANNDITEKVFKREKITIKNVPYYGFIDREVGYIQLGGFTKDAAKEVRKAFTELKDKGAKSLIIDLRGNPGGLLNESVDIANIWIKKGQEIVSTRGKASRDSIYRTLFSPIDTTMPLAILVNRGSASASEILSGSLQDLDRGIIIGERTFGKGLVQTTRPLSYKTYLKITTAKYYIPSGRCIQALDYSHRNEDGSVGYIPDSLISAFKTKNGRTVYDGGGISPDVDVISTPPANITVSLYLHNLIFDFATLFAQTHDSICTPEKFQISNELYAQFTDFLKDKAYDYNTLSNDKLNDLITTAKREGYYNVASNEIEALRTKLSADKNLDLQTFSKEIREFLREEIVSRYYYQTGRIRASLADDDQLNMAVRLLHEVGTVDSILHGTYQNGTIKLAIKEKNMRNDLPD
jgi:carboxyl-terminal processing protease